MQVLPSFKISTRIESRSLSVLWYVHVPMLSLGKFLIYDSLQTSFLMMIRFMRKIFHQLASPKFFYQISGRLIPWLWIIFLVFLIYGLIAGLLFAPPDYQQGDAYRIIYIHVP